MQVLGLVGVEHERVAPRAEVRLKVSHGLARPRVRQPEEERDERRIRTSLRLSNLPPGMTLGNFDFGFQPGVDRKQVETLATGAFIARQDNLVFVGKSGVGKSFLIQAIAEAACVRGYSVRYTTSAALLTDLTASLADQTLPQRVRYYCRRSCMPRLRQRL